MTTFTWNTLKVSVGEMNRAAALDCSRAVSELMTAQPQSTEAFQAELDWLYIQHSPVRVWVNGELLDTGDHILDIEDNVLALTLPMTRACFQALPASLASQWSTAAGEANRWLSDFFQSALNRILQSVNGNAPVSTPP